MAREVLLPPSAAALSNSMRDIGYSFETAVADLIDNSITAQASAVKIYCLHGGRGACRCHLGQRPRHDGRAAG